MNNWTLIASQLKEKMAEKEPEIKIRDVMNWFGLASTSSASYYLYELEEIGAVKHIGEKWYLAW